MIKRKLQYKSTFCFSRGPKYQNPETPKVTLNYKFCLPVVGFGIKFHESGRWCQRKDLAWTKGKLVVAKWLVPRDLWHESRLVDPQYWRNSHKLRISSSEREFLTDGCTPRKSVFSCFYTAAGPLKRLRQICAAEHESEWAVSVAER